MFEIITITLGRELYLHRLLDSMVNLGGLENENFRHHIVFQNGSLTDATAAKIRSLPAYYQEAVRVAFTKEVESVGSVLNDISSLITGDYVLKLDDDAKLSSADFFTHAKEIIRIHPYIVFSPFPVGLINNLGGVPSNEREVRYSTKTDTQYTFRKVPHVGGFARFCTASLLKQVKFSDAHAEDGEFSAHCNANGVGMYYLENALIVEHQESTLGQHARYGKNYFAERF